MFLRSSPRVFFIGGFWMGKSDIVWQMYKALNGQASVKLFNTDKNRGLLDTGERLYDFGTYGPVYLKTELIKKIEKYNPEIIICCAGGLSFREEDLPRLKKYKLIGISLSDPDVFSPTTSKIAKNFDLFYTNAVLSLPAYKKIGIDAELLPFAANPKFHMKSGPVKKYITDLLLIGNYRADRVDVVKAIQKEFNLTVFGEGWEQAGIKSRGHIEGREMIKAINSAKICLDFPRTMAGYDNVKIRIFEYGCCGALVFTGEIEEIKRYFCYDKEIIGYKNINELRGKIKYYLKNPKEAQKIRDNMHKKCQTEHTWQNRWKGVLSEAENL